MSKFALNIGAYNPNAVTKEIFTFEEATEILQGA